jgi:glucose-1-phosphate cytidylyltransferase
MDTYKDAVVLNDLWAAGEAPWRIWEDDAERAGDSGQARVGDAAGGPDDR